MEDLNKYLPQDEEQDGGIEVFFLDHDRRADFEVHAGNVTELLEAEISDLDQKIRECGQDQTWDPEEMVEMMREGFRWVMREIGKITYSDVSEAATAMVAVQWLMVLGALVERPEMEDLVRACHPELCEEARRFERQQMEQLRQMLSDLKQQIESSMR